MIARLHGPNPLISHTHHLGLGIRMITRERSLGSDENPLYPSRSTKGLSSIFVAAAPYACCCALHAFLVAVRHSKGERELVVIWKWHAFRSSISANSQRGWRSVCVSPWILVAFFHFLHKKANAALLNHIHAHSSKALTSGSHLKKPVSVAPEFHMKQCG